MPRLSPKVFVSSTYVDLCDARAELCRWLSGVFGTTMVVMETSGSDTAPPNVNSARRVRQCDIFVGIYANRYGTIDRNTGKSITELELDEARAAHSAGVVGDILLYVIDASSPWLAEYRDTSGEAENGRARLRQKCTQHTYTSFKAQTDLLFSVVRDVYRVIARDFVAGQRRIRDFTLPAPRQISRPLGMEFLTSADGPYLIGRDQMLTDAVAEIVREPIVLLLGESGVGKTSLIHAGIIPECAKLGWRPVYVRPLGLPSTDVVEQLESSVFEGDVRRYPLLQTVAEALGASGDRTLLLVIDQFEDVLSSLSKGEVAHLIAGLRALRELVSARLRILIAYRSDLEGRLGTFWQQISGSPSGFPRIYVSGLEPRSAWRGVQTFCESLNINLQVNPDEADAICGDTLILSGELAQTTIYPPYVQMLLDYVWHSTDGRMPRQFTFGMYRDGGSATGIVRRFLQRQLDYANDDTGELRLILVSLVKSYGTKAQRSLEELASDTGLEPPRCESQLKKLIRSKVGTAHFDAL